MGFATPRDWSKESDTLYIHDNGTRIAKTTYQHKDGWFLMPVDLDLPVLEFPATDAGREQAFEAYEKGALKAAKKKAQPVEEARATRGRKKAAPEPEPEEGEERPEGGEAAAEGEAASASASDDGADEDEDEEEEDEEDEPSA